MTPGTRRIGAILAVVLLLPAVGLAQGYRLRVDAGVQSVRFRGYQLDSVQLSEVDTLSDGSLESSDGFAVDCGTVVAYCSFFPAPPRMSPSGAGWPIPRSASRQMPDTMRRWALPSSASTSAGSTDPMCNESVPAPLQHDAGQNPRGEGTRVDVDSV